MAATILHTVEMHTGGEPTRIVVAGWPAFASPTLLGKRREAMEHFDHLRRALMHEPRGHADMYGALIVPPDDPAADLAVLFLHGEGYSTMCGHATIALARWAVDTGRVELRQPVTEVRLQCPCGLVVAKVDCRSGSAGAVSFESVPAFAYRLDAVVPTSTWGPLTVDIGYGGAFYAVLAADAIGLDVRRSPLRLLIDAGEEIASASAASLAIEHPEAPDLAYIYGTILTDGGDGANGDASRNACIFAGRQLDRSPTGSGVTARLALAAARREVKAGDARLFESVTGARFGGRILRETRAAGRRAVIVEVSGEAHYTGECTFRFEDHDPLRFGFALG